MKKLIAMLVLSLLVCGQAHAMSLFNKSLNDCLQKAGQESRIPNTSGGGIGNAVDDKKLTQGYCTCYKLHAPKNLGQIQYYCSQYPV